MNRLTIDFHDTHESEKALIDKIADAHCIYQFRNLNYLIQFIQTAKACLEQRTMCALTNFSLFLSRLKQKQFRLGLIQSRIAP